ncbi:nucleotidyl transferase AbiEii/AbiGii toxin family protein [Larkinella insperata]|uniref:Nucleotidyl transferase AbiEii/AbiGii toxin family protein n=1 Tax=Larkinella insperata TaxID=332158 RepID=A0ABW3QFM9_9BACT
MNTSPSKAIVEEIAQIKGISEAFVEKDWYVTQVIRLITSICFQDFTLVFTGGTALSKAHGLIQRFSEDIDFRVMAPSLIAQNKSQQSKTLSAFKKAVIDILQTDFVIDESQITARNGNRFIAIELNYHTLFGRADALRPHILLELTVSDLFLPAVNLSVSSFINEVAKRQPEVESINCIDPVENAADKLSAITWRIPDRKRGTVNDDPYLVRHIHDLAILSDRVMDHPEFQTLVRSAIDRDDKRSKAITGFTPVQKFTIMLGILASDSGYLTEYERFVNGMSYAPSSSVLPFQKAIEKVNQLINLIIKS